MNSDFIERNFLVEKFVQKNAFKGLDRRDVIFRKKNYLMS